MENGTRKIAQISLMLNIILAIFVLILFIKMPAAGKSNYSYNADADTLIDMSNMSEKGANAVIVYYNSDSLNTKALLIKEIQEDLMKAQKNAEDKLKSKQSEIMKWEQKWKDKGMLMSSEQEQYYKEAQQKEMELMSLQQKLEQELYEKQSQLTLVGITRIRNYSKQLAAQNGYDFVISYQLGGQLVFCNPKMDITEELIDLMNADYNSSSSNIATEGN